MTSSYTVGEGGTYRPKQHSCHVNDGRVNGGSLGILIWMLTSVNWNSPYVLEPSLHPSRLPDAYSTRKWTTRHDSLYIPGLLLYIERLKRRWSLAMLSSYDEMSCQSSFQWNLSPPFPHCLHVSWKASRVRKSLQVGGSPSCRNFPQRWQGVWNSLM